MGSKRFRSLTLVNASTKINNAKKKSYYSIYESLLVHVNSCPLNNVNRSEFNSSNQLVDVKVSSSM